MGPRWFVTMAVASLFGGIGTSGWIAGVPASAAGAAPAGFTTVIDNPYFPLSFGTRLVYRGVKDGRGQTDRVTVTDRMKTITGVEVVVVRDVAKHGDRLLEKTFDWYAQDSDGNVWYFGENTKAFDADGTIDTEGSWEAGVDGAVPGIIMEADPQVADGYRQEYYAGHAEDQAWVQATGGRVRVPYGTVHRALRTVEWSPLEPHIYTLKFYALGIGIVREVDVSGPAEFADLVQARIA